MHAASTAPHNAITEPTDRSMFAMISTNVMPTATTVMSGIWLAIVVKVLTRRKCLVRMLKMATRTTTTPSRPR